MNKKNIVTEVIIKNFDVESNITELVNTLSNLIEQYSDKYNHGLELVGVYHGYDGGHTHDIVGHRSETSAERARREMANKRNLEKKQKAVLSRIEKLRKEAKSLGLVIVEA